MLVGIAPHTLYEWKRRFEARGPAGLADRRTGKRKGSRLAEPIRRAILMMKEAHPDWGQERLHDMLLRAEGFAVSPGAIAAVLERGGLRGGGARRQRRNEPAVRTFERAHPNELWQTDLFTFVLKRERRRVHLVAFMDDHSRFIVGYGLHASASGAMVQGGVPGGGGANFGAPREVLTDNGTQYKTWRGVSAFTAHAGAARDPARGGPARGSRRRWARRSASGGPCGGSCLEPARVPRAGGRAASHRALHRLVQLPAPAPGDRRDGAGGPLLRGGAAGEGDAAVRGWRRTRRRWRRHGAPRKPFYLTGRVGDAAVLAARRGREGGADEGGRARGGGPLGAGTRAAEDAPATDLPEPVAVTAEVADLLGARGGRGAGRGAAGARDVAAGRRAGRARGRCQGASRHPRPEADGAVERPANDGPATPAGGDA